MTRRDNKFDRAYREQKRQQLTRMAQMDAMEKRLRAQIQENREKKAAARETAATGEGEPPCNS